MGVLELLLQGNWDADNQDKTRRNFERLNNLFGLVAKDADGFGFSVLGIGVRWGTGITVFTASKTSAALAVAHGLGRTPIAVVHGSRDPIFGYATTARDATNITVRGFVTDNVTTLTGSTTFDWIAIG